jgi:hypothetical protein
VEEGGARSAGVLGDDSRRQAKFLLAWGFLLVGIALLLRAFLTGPTPAVAEAAGTGEGAVVADPVAEEEAPAPHRRWPRKGLGRGRRGVPTN